MKKLAVMLIGFALCTVLPQNAHATSDIGLKSAGFEVGVVNPEDVDAALGVGGFLDLGTFAPNIAFSTHLNYWSSSEEFFDGAEASLRDISMTARAEYLFDLTGSRVRPFLGGGLGLHFLHAEVFFPEEDLGGGFFLPAMTIEDSKTEIGLDLGGGIQVPMSDRSSLRADLYYSVVDDVSQLALKAGMAFQLGR